MTPAADEPLADYHRRVVDELVAAYERERQTRMSLLRRHAGMAVSVGVFMTIGGAPQTIETLLGEWVRPVLGGLAILSGVLLAVGLRRHRDRLTLEAVALLVLGTWDLFMCLAFGIGLALFGMQHGIFVVAPWSTAHIPIAQPVIYSLPLYAGLASMVWGVHYRAIRREQGDLHRLNRLDLT